MRLVDADALKCKIDEEWFDGYPADVFIGYIEAAPIIDAVPVVRCKDCKHSQTDTIFNEMWCGGREISPEGFCEKGAKNERT